MSAQTLVQSLTSVSLKLLVAVGLVLLAGACSTQLSDVLPDRKVDYKKQKVAGDDLEVPPDLTSGTIGDAMPVPEAGAGIGTTYSEYEEQRRSARPGSVVAAGGAAVLPEMDNVRVIRDGDQRWLEIDAPPEDVWPRVISFWRENGVLLVEQDPTVGVMKTDWLENRADIKQGFVTELFRKALDSLYSAATRDQFRVRLEPGIRPGTTDLFLTQRGMEEKLATNTGGETENSYWVPRPNDPGLEAEMLRRIMLYLGVADKQAERALAQAETRQQPRSQISKGRDGQTALLVGADFASAWRLVGLALERVGFAVEDRDRSAGVYYVRYDDPTRTQDKGFLAKLAFWREKETLDADTPYQVRLTADSDESTRAVVLDGKGQPEQTDTGTRILTLIQEQIR